MQKDHFAQKLRPFTETMICAHVETYSEPFQIF